MLESHQMLRSLLLIVSAFGVTLILMKQNRTYRNTMLYVKQLILSVNEQHNMHYKYIIIYLISHLFECLCIFKK